MDLAEEVEKNSKPDKIIETIISKIFFYGDRVLKVYKYGKFFFGDFGDPEFRKNFYEEDFYWNNLMAPQIYAALHKVSEQGHKDYIIEMKKFDDDKNLTNLLLKKEIGKEDLKKISGQLILRLNQLTQNRKEKYSAYFSRRFYDIHIEDLESDRNLLYLIPEKISKEKVDKISDRLKYWSEKSFYFKNFDSQNLSLLIDNHADNIIFENNAVQFIDVVPPKESWRVGDLNFVICRLATDAAVLHSGEIAGPVFELAPPQAREIYCARSAMIQAWCFYSANKPEIAQKYLDFAEKMAASLGA